MSALTEGPAPGVRLLFFALLLWMPLQYLITAKYGETYPALTMPGFPGTLTDPNGNIRITDVACHVSFSDGSAAWTSANELLSQAPTAYQDPIMRHMFSPVPADSNADTAAGRIIARLFPGRSFSRSQHARQELDPQTRDWLRDRIEALYPSRMATVVTFVWYAEIFNLNRAQPEITRQSLGFRKVRLQ